MLQILFFAFPTMVLLIGVYLLLYQQILKDILKLESSKSIIAFAVTYFALAIVGFFSVLNGYETFTLGWILFILIFTGFMVYLFLMIYKINNRR